MKRGLEPAYPTKGRSVVIGQQSSNFIDVDGHSKVETHNVFGEEVHDGISVRLLIAKDAMCGLLSNVYISERLSGNNSIPMASKIAMIALEAADALIKAEEDTRS